MAHKIKIFVNLPVKDLKKSMDFFSKLGFKFNPQFTNETAACMIVSEENYVMLLTEEIFKFFTTKEIPDSTKTAESIVSLMVESKDKVDELVKNAFAAGGKPLKEPLNMDEMYGWSFQDLDNHLWEVGYMDTKAVKPIEN